MLPVILFSAVGLLLLVFLCAWLITHIRYQITSRHVRILLFGIPLRWVRIDQIASVSKRRTGGLSENWPSTFREKHRLLVIRRKRGWFKNVAITPRNRYAFKFALEQAMQRVTASPSGTQENEPVFED